MHRELRRFATSVVLACAASAQTFVVDAANGPGSHFTEIDAAAATVPDGSTLLVRPGAYAPFAIHAKGLTVLGGPGVRIVQGPWHGTAITVRQTSPQQPVVLRGLQLTEYHQMAWIHACTGLVVCEAIDVSPLANGSFRGPTWTVEQSTQVLLRDCVSRPARVVSSSAVFDACRLEGFDGCEGSASCLPAPPALSVTGGTVQLVNASLRGSHGEPASSPPWPNREAIRIDGGQVRVLGTSRLESGSAAGLAPVPAAAGFGTLRLDPATVLATAAVPALDPALQTAFTPAPLVHATSAGPGASLVGTAAAPPGTLVVLVVGYHGPPVSLAGVDDSLWLDPAVHHFATFGVVPAGVPLTASVAVPNVAAFVGTRILWQAVAALPAGLAASNPSLSLVR